MDSNNWRPTQGASGAVVDPSMEIGDWRAQLQADSRQRIVNKIMDTLKRHLPFSGNEGLQELKKIAVRFEEKIYTAATSQSDYLRKISLKMLTMENRSQNPMPDAMQSSSAANSVNPSDPGSQVMQQGPQIPISAPSNNIQSGHPMMSQSMQSTIGSVGMQSSSNISSALPPGSGLQHSTIANVAGQNSNMQNIQSMSGVQQTTVGNTMGPGCFANQRQQIQQTQNSQYLYQQKLHQMAKQTLQQPSSNFDPGQNSSMNSLQQVSSGSLQQNTMSGPQQVNINPVSLQTNTNMLQHQHIKQEQLLQSQQLKQFQQRQMQQQFLHKQQLMQQQQLHQQTKQHQLSGQMQGNQLSQLHQINDGSDIKLRQQMGVKSSVFQQHHAAAAQRSAYHQQLKPGAPFSPQLLSSASPQMSQHASPQIDQSNMFKSANSPFTAPSPSTSSASPMPGELINGVPSSSNVGHQQPSSAVLPIQSLAIGTPGISASPLLAEFTSPDGNHGAVASIGSGKSVTEQPLERLLKVVKSMSPKALSASVFTKEEKKRSLDDILVAMDQEWQLKPLFPFVLCMVIFMLWYVLS